MSRSSSPLLTVWPAGPVRHGILLACWLLLAARSATAAGPAVEALEVYPSEIRLQGKDAQQQLLVTARLTSEVERDVGREATYRSADPRVAAVDAAGLVRPLASGSTAIEVAVAGRRVHVPVHVEQGERYLPVDFRRDVVPILTHAGCNSGGCHGKADGRGGLALSLFGFDPATDYDALVKGSRGRRLLPQRPELSLFLRKPLAEVAHGGGRRLERDTPEHDRLARWIAAGAPWGEATAPGLSRIEVAPPFSRVERRQTRQVLVTAVFTDGSRRDVTRLTEFRSNDPAVATVDEQGLVSVQDRAGETAVVCSYGGHVGVARILVPQDLLEAQVAGFPPANVIDGHVLAKLRQLRVPPSPLVDDAGFLRRASLQIAGRLPTAEEARHFLADPASDRRTRLVDQLLASGAYADHFAQKWADILRNKRRRQKEREPGTIGFHRWIRNALADNMPYDRFVEEILTATGSPAVHPAAQWYAEVRYLDRYVDDTAQVFLGVRIGCARCHNHPFERFTQEDYYGLAAFFARVGRKGGEGIAERRANETILVQPAGEVKHPLTGQVVLPHGLGQPPLEVASYDDPRRHLVAWLRRPDNPYFARAFVNRMWAHFFGRGLVEPLDDLRATNPAANEPLLDALATEFVRSGYDMRHIVRLICTSTTYQLSAAPTPDNADDTQAHSRFYPQRLAAEVLLDAVDSVTGAPTSYAGLPPGTRAVQLPDEDHGNAFLGLFGRPPRESACECERVSQPNLSQALFLMNDDFFLAKLRARGGLAERLARDPRGPAACIEELFLTALTRLPTPDEAAKALAYLRSEPDAATAYRNLTWALLNTKEFLYVR